MSSATLARASPCFIPLCLLATAVVAGVGGCGGNGGMGPQNPTPTAIASLSGNNQSGTAGQALSQPLVVKVTDKSGAGVSGVALAWAVTGGGGSLSGTSTTTDAQGQASVVWTLGTAAGSNTSTATAAGLTGSPVTFTATGGAGPPSATQSLVVASPATIPASSGANQSTITMTVKDALGNLVSGATVSLTATGTGNALTQPVGATNASGQITGTLSSTKAEAKTITAKVNGTVMLTQAATVTVTAGAASGLAFTVQPTTTQGGTAITPPVQVTAQDAFGNIATGFTGNVTVAIGTNPSSGTLSGTTMVAATAGVATFANLRLDNAGTGYTLTAAATGLPGATSAAFTVTGPPASLVVTPKPLITEVGSSASIGVVVKDANGNAIPNPAVTFVSRNPSVASVSPTGGVSGLARGQAVGVATATGGTSPADSLLAVVAVAGGPVLMTDIAQFSYATGTMVTVTVVMDMRDSGELLGSTTVTVTWDAGNASAGSPALLTFQGAAAGSSGVTTYVNTSNVGNGSLVLSMADPNGFAGRVELLKITFTAGLTPAVAGVLALIPADVTGAKTFTDLLPRTVAVTYPLITR